MIVSVVLAGVLAAGGCTQSLVDSDDNAAIQAALDSLPRNVVDLTVVSQSATTLRLRLTEVEDGLGNPASYAVRFADRPFSWSDAAATEFIISGWRVGDPLEFAVTDLVPGNQYYVQCTAFRGTLGVDAVFSPQLSNVASGSTGVIGPPPPPGASEPVFDANLHNSLWFDDFSSYGSLADMQAGNGARQWGGNFGGWAFKGGATPQDNYIQADYQGTGEITREITARDDVLAGTDPQQVLMTALIRSVGRSYQGKVIVFKSGGMPSTTMRWVPRITSSNPIPVPDLSETYWEPTWPWDRLPGTDAVPRADSYGLAVARDWGQCGAAQSHWDYKQNVGWSQLQPWAHWNDGPWHRWTVRWTKGGGTGPCGDGKGRIEWWWDGVLVFQWLGDDPARSEYGKVFVSGAGDHAIGQPYWFGPSKFNWQGGGYLELNEVRFYSVK